MSNLRQRIETVLRRHKGTWMIRESTGQVFLKCCELRFNDESDQAAHVADAVLAALQLDIDAIAALADKWDADANELDSDYAVHASALWACAAQLRTAVKAWNREDE